jgi:hypothetical protein
MRAIGRLFAAGIGFICAVVAVAVFMLAAEVGLSPAPGDTPSVYWGQFAIYGSIAAAFVGAMVFVPWAVAALVTEIFSLRSIFVHVGGGGLIGLGASVLSARGPVEGIAAYVGSDLTLFVAAGFVGGFVYWLIAGRMAGLKPVGGPARGEESPPTGPVSGSR